MIKTSFNNKQKLKTHKKHTKKSKPTSIILCTVLILISLFLSLQNTYVENESKDLQYAVEHSFTSGINKNNKLLRVKYISLISLSENSATVEVSGLSKTSPHKETTITGIFIKNNNNSWHLEKISN